MKNISVSLNEHFQEFINNQANSGNYASVSEVVRTALRMLEEHEMKVQHLRVEIQKGLESFTVSGEHHHERFAKKREAELEVRGIEKPLC